MYRCQKNRILTPPRVMFYIWCDWTGLVQCHNVLCAWHNGFMGEVAKVCRTQWQLFGLMFQPKTLSFGLYAIQKGKVWTDGQTSLDGSIASDSESIVIIKRVDLSQVLLYAICI